MVDRIIPPTRNFIRNRINELTSDIEGQINGALEYLSSDFQESADTIVDSVFTKETAVNNEIRDVFERVFASQKHILNYFEKTTPRAIPRMIEIHLTDHCNLNCKGCAHFSPVADEKYADLNIFIRDMKRLSELYDGILGEIHLMGGEPLLHPQAIEFAIAARTLFPNTHICYVTNGIILQSMEDYFFEKCSEYKIAIRPTKYPIKVDYSGIEERAYKYKVEYRYYGGGTVEKTLWKDVLDPQGLQDTEQSFLSCHRSNKCVQLRNGRIFPCPIAAYAHLLNARFGEMFHITERDSIDIFNVDSADAINLFLSHSIPFCRYCNIKSRELGLPWSVSNGSLDEWI